MAKRYKCPYCELRLIRKDLIKHIDKKHEELIPQGYSSARLVYNQVNKIDHGKCRVCGKPTSWNEKSGRYNVLCDNPKCKEHMREEYKKNMLRVRGTYNILNDPEQQKKMLANRSISGSYKFSDGGILTYTGSYEKKCLEFMDVVMQIPSKDILSPGPTIEYEYNGSKHFYITDFYYIPYNLIIEVKDGGDNLNNKDSSSMRASREKTIEKERIITDRGEYNYIRLTNNNFSQLLDVFMTIKEKLLEGDVSKTYKINESVINDYFIEGNIISKIKNALKIDTNTKFNINKASISDFNKFYNNNDFFIESLFDKESDLTDEKAQIIANNIASINISIKYKTVDIYLIKNSLLNNKYDLHKSNKFNDKSYSIVFPLNLFRSNEHYYVKELFHARYFNDVIDNREYREVKMGYHKMSPQVQWLADIDNNHKINESVIFESAYSKYYIKNQVKRIAEKVKKDKKDPTGNQNCMLCTWCMEAWFRGYDILPRPVYSPTDKIFDFEGYDIIKRPTKITINDKNDIKKFVLAAGDRSRFYVHFKWKNGNGGHEFLLINIRDEIYLIDAQSNIFEKITSPKVSSYFRDVDYEKSFIVRADDKEINTSMLKYNDMEPKEFTPEDMKYIHDNDLIKKEYTMESIIFNSKDTYYNKDKFDSGEINLCFITGFSGSGKTTMACEMEKNGIEKYELDDIVFQFNFSDENLKEYGGMISSFFNGHGKKYRKIDGYKYFKTDEQAKQYEYNICIDFIEYSKKYAASHKDRKFVIEGVEILTGYIDKFDSLKNYAIYIKGTSFLNSYIRVAKREALNEEKSFDKIKTFAKLIFHSGRFKHYINANSSLNKIKNKINNYTNESNDYITESPDKSSLSKGFKIKPNNIQYKILPLNKPEIYDYIGKYFSKNNPMWEGVVDSKTYMDCFINGNNSRHIKRVGEVLINKSNDEVIGYEVVEKPDNFLAIEIPNKKYRGYGFGNMLLEDAIKKHGCRKLYVAADNEIALKMYENRGFEIIKKYYDDEYYLMELKESSINELCTINTSNTFIQTYIRLFVDYIQKKYKSNIDTIDIKIVHSKQAIEMKKKKLKYINYSNDFIVINYNQITIVDEDVYGNQPINYNSFLKFHITKVLLSTCACDDNIRLINAICTYESGIYNEIGEKTSEFKDAGVYADYLKKHGPNMVVNNLIKRSHTEYPIF